ncbi:MAG: EAL domain-containing protein [Actinomycetota bacterium]
MSLDAALVLRRVRHPNRGLSLHHKFGLISLVAFTLIGAFLGQMLRTSMERQILAGSIAEAEVVAKVGLQNAIEPGELHTGLTEDRARSLQITLRSEFARIDVVDVVLWNLDGTVVFATDTQRIGAMTEVPPEVGQAMAGEPLAIVNDLSEDPAADPILQRHGTLLEVYQPIAFGSVETGELAGVLRTSVPYAPIAENIQAESRRLYLAIAGVFVFLHLVLFRLVANASAELRRRADENEQQARHDALTGLPNRTLFAEELNAILDREGPEALAIALIDLDRFKEVNDTLGHHQGDKLLIEIGNRLSTILRPGDTVARLGGDEFGLILTEVDSADATLAVTQRVVRAIEAPFETDDLTLDVGASIGIALAPDHGHDLATLLQRADIAMYQAKRSGGGCALYSESDDTNSRRLLSLTGDLRHSMAEQLIVHYQPKVLLAEDRVAGVEALVRWQHPDHGVIPPNVFLPLAERAGMMDELTAIVLEKSLVQVREWLDVGLDLHVAVNISARGLHRSGLADVVTTMLTRHRVPGNRLVLEITERAIADDPDGAHRVLTRLGEHGVRFSIDDFGTGYSSLAVLRKLPVDELKIDRQFVAELSMPESHAIVDYSIQLGHMLGLQVVAEGVEDELATDTLRRLGCDLVQGYLYSRALPAEDLAAWLARPRPWRATAH